MDAQEQSIKPGDSKSIAIAIFLLLSASILAIYRLNNILLPIENVAKIDNDWMYATYGFTVLMVVSSIISFATIHRTGFRWFTAFNKTTRPDLSWLIIIGTLTEIFVLVIADLSINWYYDGQFSELLQNGLTSNNISKFSSFLNLGLVIAVFLILLVLLYFLVLSITTRMLVPVSLRVALQSSVLNLVVILLCASPFIAYTGWTGLKMRDATQELEENGVYIAD